MDLGKNKQEYALECFVNISMQKYKTQKQQMYEKTKKQEWIQETKPNHSEETSRKERNLLGY